MGSLGEDVEKLEPWDAVGGNVGLCKCHEVNVAVPQDVKNRMTMGQGRPTSFVYTQKN